MQSIIIYLMCCIVAIFGCYFGPDLIGIVKPAEPPVGVWIMACFFIGLKLFSEALK